MAAADADAAAAAAPGDKATIVVRPMRDGSPGGMFVRATLADGRELTVAGQPVEP